MSIAFLAAAFAIVEVIVITSGRYAAVIIITVSIGEFIAGTTTGVGDEAGGCELDGGGVVKPFPTPP